jgi:hypothetical protein
MEQHVTEIGSSLLVTLLLGASLFGGAAVVLGRLWRAAHPVDHLLGSIVAGLAVLSVTLPLLSGFAALTRGSLLILSIAMSALGLAAYAFRRPLPIHRSVHDPLSWPTMVTIWIGAWALLYYFLRGLLLPVETVSDGPIYHLYFAARWWQSASLPLVATPFGEQAATYFPGNGELWLTWLWVAMGNELLAKVGQWPFLFICILAMYGLARRIVAGTSPSHAAAIVPAFLWSSTFLALFSSSLANVDLIFAASYLTAVYFLVRSFEEDSRWHLLFFALAAGLTLGTKTIGIAYVAVLLPVAGWRVLQGGKVLSESILVGVGLLLPCIYWYGRNFWLTGNPIYPLQVNLFGIELLPGWYDRETMRRSGYHVHFSHWRYLLSRLSTVVDLRLFVAWALALFGVVLAGIRKELLPSLLFLLGLVLVAIYWFLIPYNTQERFLLPSLALTLVPLAVVLSRWPWLAWPIAGLLAWHLLTPSWYLTPDLSFETNGIVVLPFVHSPLAQGSLLAAAGIPVAMALALLSMRTHWRGRWIAGAIAVTVGAFISSWPVLQIISRQPAAGFYPSTDFASRLLPAWLVLETASQPSGANVAYTGTNLPYYLLGSHRTNRIRYVNIAGEPDWQMHDFARQRKAQGFGATSIDPWPNWHRENGAYETWLKNLRAAGIEYVFIARENQHARLDAVAVPPYPIEYEWTRIHPETFKLVGPDTDASGGQPWAIVYRVRPENER